MKLSGAQITIETLIEQGTKFVFGYPGGQVINLYDAIYEADDRIHHVLTAHEQGASHAADGYARSSGGVGVVIATSGPGATNLVTGIATAYLDSASLVAITGNVPNSLIGRDSFQEVDITGITIPVTKHNFFVKRIEDLADTIRHAFQIAKSGRPGPVLIDIPKDVQIKAKTHKLEKLSKMIKESQRPFIYVGGGALVADATQEIEQLANVMDAPIGSTLMGLSSVYHNNPRFLGMVGMHGHYASSKSLSEADLLIVIGARFSDRATGDVNKYGNRTKIVHIDIDRAEVDKNIIVNLGIGGDVKEALQELLPMLETKSNVEWQKRIEALKQEESQQFERTVSLDTLNPYTLITEVQKYTTPDMPIATDVGQHQMWVAQYYQFNKPRTFITSGGLGTMGFGMGAAIGSALATGKKTVLFTGDGSFGMNMNELSTLSKLQAPVVIIIMNNGVLGMVRQWQNLFFDEHFTDQSFRSCQIIKNWRMPLVFHRIVLPIWMSFIKYRKSNAYKWPGFGRYLIDKDEMVLPMLPPGGSFDDIITEMEEN